LPGGSDSDFHRNEKGKDEARRAREFTRGPNELKIIVETCPRSLLLEQGCSDDGKWVFELAWLGCSERTVLSYMDREQAIDLINSSLREGAELRTVIARDSSTAIFEAARLITICFRSGGKLLFFGNGGSAADAQHLAAEFVGRFVRERAGLPAIALTTDSSILTAVANDYGFDQVFARQVQALGRPSDVAIAISTSGNSPNIIEGVKAAKRGHLKIIGLSGKDGGLLAKQADVAITIASKSTARIQECHIAVGHLLCELTEEELEGGSRESQSGVPAT
jgi:D-sedoheptulose 7-phosphate isomerase